MPQTPTQMCRRSRNLPTVEPRQKTYTDPQGREFWRADYVRENGGPNRRKLRKWKDEKWCPYLGRKLTCIKARVNCPGEVFAFYFGADEIEEIKRVRSRPAEDPFRNRYGDWWSAEQADAQHKIDAFTLLSAFRRAVKKSGKPLTNLRRRPIKARVHGMTVKIMLIPAPADCQKTDEVYGFLDSDLKAVRDYLDEVEKQAKSAKAKGKTPLTIPELTQKHYKGTSAPWWYEQHDKPQEALDGRIPAQLTVRKRGQLRPALDPDEAAAIYRHHRTATAPRNGKYTDKETKKKYLKPEEARNQLFGISRASLYRYCTEDSPLGRKLDSMNVGIAGQNYPHLSYWPAAQDVKELRQLLLDPCYRPMIDEAGALWILPAKAEADTGLEAALWEAMRRLRLLPGKRFSITRPKEPSGTGLTNVVTSHLREDHVEFAASNLKALDNTAAKPKGQPKTAGELLKAHGIRGVAPFYDLLRIGRERGWFYAERHEGKWLYDADGVERFLALDLTTPTPKAPKAADEPHGDDEQPARASEKTLDAKPKTNVGRPKVAEHAETLARYERIYADWNVPQAERPSKRSLARKHDVSFGTVDAAIDYCESKA